MTKFEDKRTALLVFEEAAIAHDIATEKGDYKTANKSHAMIMNVINFLKEQNEVISLLEFLNHPAEGVSAWAATYLLPVLEKEASNTLERIAAGKGIRSFAAQITLKEWKKGNLKL